MAFQTNVCPQSAYQLDRGIIHIVVRSIVHINPSCFCPVPILTVGVLTRPGSALQDLEVGAPHALGKWSLLGNLIWSLLLLDGAILTWCALLGLLALGFALMMLLHAASSTRNLRTQDRVLQHFFVNPLAAERFVGHIRVAPILVEDSSAFSATCRKSEPLEVLLLYPEISGYTNWCAPGWGILVWNMLLMYHTLTGRILILFCFNKAVFPRMKTDLSHRIPVPALWKGYGSD